MGADRVREEFWRIVPLIRRKGIEKVASILKDNGYSVGRNVDTAGRQQDEFSLLRDYYIKDIVARKDIGKLWLMIEISLRSKMLYAHSTVNSRTKYTYLSTGIPFRDYSI